MTIYHGTDAKSAEKIDEFRPTVAQSVFGEIDSVEEE